jgi:leucyl-tRNA synthetase
MKNYDHKKIEKKWQKEWDKNKIYKTENPGKKKKFYVLDMFPYPSGAGLHVGHPRGYIGSDVYARMKRMQGFNVLHPMGYDAFGLPAEQYAIENKIHPSKAVEKNIKTFRSQLDQIGFSYDWEKQVNTTDPSYYKWTQWIFLQIYNSYYDAKLNKARPISELIKKFEKTDKNWKNYKEVEKEKILMSHRLAYEGYAQVNWCPKLGTVLANDEIIENKDGSTVSERGGFPVFKKSMRQWFMRITAYADRLESDLKDLDWSLHIKEIQKNWIGKSIGSEIEFKTSINRNIKVFTTRADTLFGVTYLVISPEHENIGEFLVQSKNMAEVSAYVREAKERLKNDKTNDKEKTGIALEGITAINPANGEEIPVWVGDYVLANYGTGAVMAVPAHDERDFEFAKKYNLKSITVISHVGVSSEFDKDCYTGEGVLVNSGNFNGISSEESRGKITEKVFGKIVTKYKMRDAIFARQRYWGEPIPLQHGKDGTISMIKEKHLPLELPKVKSYEPIGTGESPLAGVSSWVKNGYETNTMPGWAGSSWYFLRYMDPKSNKQFASDKNIKYWKEVDVYVGGQEHATGHLLYSRFWHKFLFDMGYVPTKEPFKVLKNQGLIMASDGRKMSKRWGNVVNPDDVVSTYGADTLRVYEMFIGPFDQSVAWSTESIIGSRRFVERVYRLQEKIVSKYSKQNSIEKILHKTIKKVSCDIVSFNFNTSISAMMMFVNEVESSGEITSSDLKKFIQILAPFAPYVSEEIWANLKEKKSIHKSSWPLWDKKKIIDDEVKLVVQVNGKVRAQIVVSLDLSEEDIKKQALENENIIVWISGKEIKRIIYVKDRLINIVI